MYEGLDKSVVVDSFVEINDVNLFYKSISESKGNKYASIGFVYPASEYKTSRIFMTKDGLAGLAITKEGDSMSMFSHGLMYFVGRGYRDG